MFASFTTDAVPEKERAEYWQEMAGRVFLGLRTERRGRGPFFGMLEGRGAGSLWVTRLHSSAQGVFRGEPEIARASRECFFVAMQLAGLCTLRQGREVRQAEPGDIELLDGTRPGELSFETDYERIVVSVPYDLLRPRLTGIDRAVGNVVRGRQGVGALVSSYMRAFAQNVLPEPVTGSASDILIELLALACNAPEAGASSDGASVREARRHALKRYVERNLADPSLSPATVAARCGMSTRYLHGLFAESGETFMRWVLSRRLSRCRDALVDSALRARGIADIAFAWGFHDVSHFGRAFKAAFGMTPRDWRRVGRASG
ncbi:helix-turn-helix domain-containing protein [Sorangium sp. So ce381]|uniref:helix-turn-helix domain-containing protein n=1 Tax=Sorangium sp. So ce381 TaxID=3133307 RepID=UPI003F5B6A45